VLPDGSRNTFRIQRLKDKLGNRSNASSEPEFDDTVGWRLGEEGRGVRAIIEMVALTRLDAALGAAAGMRAALTQATHHARHRTAFGSRLVDKALMRNVLADLALESEAATTLVMRVAGAVDRAHRGEASESHASERAFARIATALTKYWVCKRAPTMVAEALECLGGNGYVEESGMPRLYREAPLNGIWEGSGNVNALDVLRALGREPASLDTYHAEVEAAAGADARLDAAWARLRSQLDQLTRAERASRASRASRAGQAEQAARAERAAGDPDPEPDLDLEWGARRLVEQMALLLQGALLVRHAPAAVADAFCASRLAGDHGLAFGTLPPGLDTDAILTRIPPAAQA
jgi:putative acyl-CoA dehydrogenase